MTDLPQIVDVSNGEALESRVADAVAALESGRLIGLPTETVYGLAADATRGDAVAAIFEAKARPRFNPLIIHTTSLAAARDLAIFDDDAERLAAAFWPGPLTLVLPRKATSPISELATVGLDTVAIRVPAHPVAQAVLKALGRPVAAPSANRSGHVSPTTARHVADDLGARVVVILDAGATGIGIESTIVGCAGSVPALLRPGGVPRDQIEQQLGRPLADAADEDGTPSAPGQLRSHYAPKARLRLAVSAVRPGEALLAFGPRSPTGAETARVVINLSPTGDLREAAARLFAALRELDAQAEAIAVVPIPQSGLGEAINDRLRRAAAPRS